MEYSRGISQHYFFNVLNIPLKYYNVHQECFTNISVQFSGDILLQKLENMFVNYFGNILVEYFENILIEYLRNILLEYSNKIWNISGVFL